MVQVSSSHEGASMAAIALVLQAVLGHCAGSRQRKPYSAGLNAGFLRAHAHARARV